MGPNTTFKSLGLAFITTSLMSTSAFAGGFDRGGVNIDQLFDESRFTVAGQVTYVDPRREINNLRRPGLPVGVFPESVNVDSSFTAFRGGIKADLTDNIACLASYSEGTGGTAGYGVGNVFSPSTVDFDFSTRDYGLTCSYQFSAGSTSVGDAFARVILGGSYLEAEGLQTRQSFLLSPAPPVPDPTGIGRFTIEDESYGWRAGFAYEIPDIALRASIVYNSEYDLDFTGTQDSTGFGIPSFVPGTIRPISINGEIPESLDLKFQTGIREGTLAFLNVRWQNWSQLDILPVVGGSNPLLALEPGFRDGYTVTAGIGQVLTDDLAARVALTWDRGTSTTSGTQRDTWTLSAGLRYDVNESTEFNIGGAIGVMGSGSSSPLPNSQDPAGAVTYNYDSDLIYAVSTGFKFKFN